MQTISAGVSLCSLSVTPKLASMAERLRAAERTRATATDRNALRAIATKGVDAAEALAADQGIPDGELIERCLALRGKPWSQARARREMRELMRVWRLLRDEGARVPSSVPELFSLWEEATRGEIALYRESEKAQFRTRIPFAHGKDFFEFAPPAPGQETVPPADIEREVNNLFTFLQRDDIPAELHAMAALFAYEYVHPFPDGNGRTGRMLCCLMLRPRYSPATLVAFVAQLQGMRAEVSDTIRAIRCECGDIGPYVELHLGALQSGQSRVRQFEFVT